MIAKLVVVLVGVTYLFDPVQAPVPATSRTLLAMTVPSADSEVEIDGAVIPGTGISRTYETAPLAVDRTYQYKVTAKWQPNTYTNMSRTKVVTFRPGERVTIDLSIDDPSDRVVVRYVPTPEQIVMEMVKLAGITAADVIYEPGCGDARITIAAVKSGARVVASASISIPSAWRNREPMLRPLVSPTRSISASATPSSSPTWVR
jgi:uncharacterized protein (TIGR03000 family)